MPLKKAEDGDLELYSELFRCLGHPTRRRILFELLDRDPQAALNAPDDVHVGGEDLDRLKSALTHNHLPVLVEAGFIRWDREAGEVHHGPKFVHVQDLLTSIRENIGDKSDPPW